MLRPAPCPSHPFTSLIPRRHHTHHVEEVGGTQGWKVEDQQRNGEPPTDGPCAILGDPAYGPRLQRKDPHSANRSRSSPSLRPHSHGNDAKCTIPSAQQASMTRRTSCGEERVTVQGPARATGRPQQHRPRPQQTKYWASDTRKRSNVHRPHGRGDGDDPTHSAKGRKGDYPGSVGKATKDGMSRTGWASQENWGLGGLQEDGAWRSGAPGPHAHGNAARQVVDDQRAAEVLGQQKPSKDPSNNQHNPGSPTTGHRTRTNSIRRNQHSPGTPTTGLRERGNDTSKSTGRSGQHNTATRRNIRREERVTVQGPGKKQQHDGMSHRGAGSCRRMGMGALGPCNSGPHISHGVSYLCITVQISLRPPQPPCALAHFVFGEGISVMTEKRPPPPPPPVTKPLSRSKEACVPSWPCGCGWSVYPTLGAK